MATMNERLTIEYDPSHRTFGYELIFDTRSIGDCVERSIGGSGYDTAREALDAALAGIGDDGRWNSLSTKGQS